MSVADALSLSAAKSKGKRPFFLDPDVERALSVAMALAQELTVARQRLDTLERLLEAKGVLTRAEIEAFTPTKDEAAERGLWTQEFLTRILRIVQQEREALAIQAEESSEQVSEELAQGSPS